MKRFWDKVAIKGKNDCWEWQAGLRSLKTGYGCFKYKGKVIDAHRFSFFLKNKYLPKKLVLHHCDNRKCVNPKHLWAGTYQDNVTDMLNKGRGNIKSRLNKIYTTHGTKTMYNNHRCRCLDCKKAYSLYQKRYR